jgi:DNA-binding GntR family transcriptional regulator
MAAGKRVQRATLTTRIEGAIRSDILDGTSAPSPRLSPVDLSRALRRKRDSPAARHCSALPQRTSYRSVRALV